MIILPHVYSGERARFFTLATLLLINSLVQESNEVISTSGFVSNLGVEQILWLWVVESLLMILVSSAYAFVVDRMKRVRLVSLLSAIFGLIYLGLYGLFAVGAPGWLSYSALAVVSYQQWLLMPLVIWAVANDVFSIAESKRLVPLIAVAGVIGGVVGNGLAAGAARWLGEGNPQLLLFNAGLLLTGGGVVLTGMRRVRIEARQSPAGEKVLEMLREGLNFLREVPAFRYLTISMIVTGICWTVIDYELLAQAAQAYPKPADLQAFYGIFKVAVPLLLLPVQGLIAHRLMNRLGFQHIFAILPFVALTSLTLALAFSGISGIVIGAYLFRITMQGIDEPARQAFRGLVPDELRGRIIAFMDGYLLPVGFIIGCGLLGMALLAVTHGGVSAAVGRALYLGFAGVSAVIALWAANRLRLRYVESMFSWRLRRRRRPSALKDLDL